jgi:phosphate starvation-inducible PhoH-like protein
MSGVSRKILLDDTQECVQLLGEHDHTLKVIESSFAIQVVARGNEIILLGDSQKVRKAEAFIDQLRVHLHTNQKKLLDSQQLNRLLSQSKLAPNQVPLENEDHKVDENVILVSSQKKAIVAKNENQRRYVQAIQSHSIVFGIGPAGTGKTYLAMAMAVSALRNAEVDRLILTRPAVEAGEKLGFLPGDLQEKVDPYLRPLYDALYEMVEYEKLQRLFQHHQIEVAPLAYMRGRTLSNAFIILDEAQNTTVEQMKMFLTRMGVGSKVVVTGDVTQVDLPSGKLSGLIHAKDVLRAIAEIQFVFFNSGDVVRHALVQSIIEAYHSLESQDAPPVFEQP